MTNTTLKAALSFIGLFVAGVVSGYFLAVVSGASTGLPAQPPVTSEAPRPDVRTPDGEFTPELQARIREMQDHMITNLNLSEEQQQPLFEMIRYNHYERRSMMQQSRQQFRELMEQHDAAFHDQLVTVLDERQIVIWDSLYSREAQMRRQQQQQRGQGQGSGSEGGRGRGQN